jgi:UDP-N-acetylglucosamine--N-acetylmuramyl-(pentapeptide) pyrophosphoryl-undecaprenol N-acetylglucosamine transferase
MPVKRTWERSIDVQHPRIIFAGGGTGGHLFPALAIAEEMRSMQSDVEILFVGTKNKIEATVVPERGYMFRTIWISGFRRRLTLSNFLVPVKVIVSVIQAMMIIKKFKPGIVVGTGGYVSGPVLYAATLAGVPTLIQEQNSYPGVTTRLLGKRVNEVHLTFEQSRRYFSRADNVFVSGNPTRRDLENVSRAEAMKYFGFSENTGYTILVVGGSLGARSINRAFIRNLSVLLDRNFQILWQTGAEDFENVKQSLEKYRPAAVRIYSFIDRMDYAYAVSDLVVCRAGATTIAELTRLGKPAILVPYPFAAADHQMENARSMAENGAAEIVKDDDLENKLAEKIVLSFQPERLRRMSECSKTLGKPDAARDLASRALRLAGVS